LNLHRTNREAKWGTVVLVLWTLILLGVLLTPIGEMNFPTPWGFKHWDKIIHFGLFAVTGFVCVFGASFLSQFKSRMIFGVVCSFVLAVGTELAQSFIATRSRSFYDLVADVVGLCVGLLLYVLLYRQEGLRSRLKL
jgi:VanZ family protein